MLLCKGRGCKYRKTCSRYVLGTVMQAHLSECDTFIDHCLHARKFEKYNPINSGQSGNSGISD